MSKLFTFLMIAVAGLMLTACKDVKPKTLDFGQGPNFAESEKLPEETTK